MKRLTLTLMTALLSACAYVPFSGGALEGQLTPPPADWTSVASADVIEFETNPSEPYSVKLWIVGEGEDLYVHAGTNRTTWVEHIEQDARVKVLIGQQLYELSAERVTAQTEFDSFSDAYEIKYGNRPRNEDVGEAYLYRLLPRS